MHFFVNIYLFSGEYFSIFSIFWLLTFWRFYFVEIGIYFSNFNRDLQGQNPVAVPFSRQALNTFDAQARKNEGGGRGGPGQGGMMDQRRDGGGMGDRRMDQDRRMDNQNRSGPTGPMNQGGGMNQNGGVGGMGNPSMNRPPPGMGMRLPGFPPGMRLPGMPGMPRFPMGMPGGKDRSARVMETEKTASKTRNDWKWSPKKVNRNPVFLLDVIIVLRNASIIRR